MEYTEILRKRRSVRSFLDRPVEKEKIEQLMGTLQYLPSSRSIFPTEFIVVNDKDILNELAKCRDHGSQFLEQAPAAIVVIADSNKSDVWIEDASIASTFLLFSAVELGLAGCWIQIRKRKKGAISSDGIISNILNIPPDFSIESIIAIGYPDEKGIPAKIKHFDLKKIYHNQYNSK
jgi:nitroreductase